MGGDGVLGGRSSDRHCNARKDGRGADRNGLQAVSQGISLWYILLLATTTVVIIEILHHGN